MNDHLDQSILAALHAEDAGFEDLDEQSLHEQLVGVFVGKSRWFATLGFVMTFVFLGLAVFSAVRFFQVDSTKELIAWATAFLFCISSIAMLKIWYWLQMNQNAVTREIKRFELQLARLQSRMGE
ncbi:MAG: DUF6768 family protein [Planctomycetota bacterium]